MSSELDLLRPFSQSLAARAEGKETAEAKAAELDAEAKTLREQLAAAVESAEKLGSRAGTAEDEAGASASKLSGLEKVVRRLGGEAEVCMCVCVHLRVTAWGAFISAYCCTLENTAVVARFWSEVVRKMLIISSWVFVLLGLVLGLPCGRERGGVSVACREGRRCVRW